MPRAQTSKESSIIRWFAEAPLAVAGLVLGLVKDAMREREGKAEAHRGPRKKAARKAHAPAPAPEVVQRNTPPAHHTPAPAHKAKPKAPSHHAKKSHHKKKATTPAAEVDNFSMDINEK